MKSNSQDRTESPVETVGAFKQGGRLTPELIRQVADKVYAMLMEELRNERERHTLESSGEKNFLGGRGWNR